MLMVNIINGLIYGALLIVICSGLALIYGLRRVINFAHGSLYMMGAYIGYTIASHSNFWVALISVPLFMAIVGACLDRFGFRLLQDRDPLTVVLVTFGLMLVIQDMVQTIWGKENYSIDTPALLATSIEVFGTTVPAYRLAVGAMGVFVALVLTLWMRLSRAGLFVRAASTDPVTTSMQGVDTDALSTGIVGLGAALAGLAGVVAAPFLALSPTMSNDVLLDSFVVVVVGGLGSLSGAFIAAIGLGLLQAIGAVYMPDLTAVLPFIVMVAILLWRPAGFAGSRT